jgi:hypothetical protein
MHMSSAIAMDMHGSNGMIVAAQAMLRIIAQGKGDRRDKQAKAVERDKRACSPNPRASAESRQHNISLPQPLKILCQGIVLFKLPAHTIQWNLRRIPMTRSAAAAVQLGPSPPPGNGLATALGKRAQSVLRNRREIPTFYSGGHSGVAPKDGSQTARRLT